MGRQQYKIMFLEQRRREREELSKKDGPSAIVVDKYRVGVEEAIEDILKRPVNKKVQFEGATFIIPENTRLNPNMEIQQMKKQAMEQL